MLLPLDDPRWKTYCGGYDRVVTNVVPFLTKLQSGALDSDDWDILWDDLHHQGDVGEASYAVVPFLAEYARRASPIAWHVFGFPAAVELARTENDNPDVPQELREEYFAAIHALPSIALSRGPGVWGTDCFEPVMACLALSLDRRAHAKAYSDLTESEIPEFYRYYDGLDADDGDV